MSDDYLRSSAVYVKKCDFEWPGCDCSDSLIPDRDVRYTRMRSWEAGAHPDREIAR